MPDYAISTTGSDILSLNQVKQHLNVSTTDDDVWIESAIDAATKLVEDMTGKVYVAQSRRMTMNGFNDRRYVYNRRIHPQRSPILSSTSVSITYVDSQGTTQTLGTSAYSVDVYDTPGSISETYNETWPDTRVIDNSVTVNYTAGMGTVPATVKHAVKMLIGHWYETREATSLKGMSSVPYGVEALLGSEMVERYG